MLFAMGTGYEYERPLEGTVDHHVLRPDFTFADPAGEPIIWEHLGMLSRDDYRQGWEWKKAWYERNGYVLGQNLFTLNNQSCQAPMMCVGPTWAGRTQLASNASDRRPARPGEGLRKQAGPRTTRRRRPPLSGGQEKARADCFCACYSENAGYHQQSIIVG